MAIRKNTKSRLISRFISIDFVSLPIYRNLTSLPLYLSKWGCLKNFAFWTVIITFHSNVSPSYAPRRISPRDAVTGKNRPASLTLARGLRENLSRRFIYARFKGRSRRKKKEKTEEKRATRRGEETVGIHPLLLSHGARARASSWKPVRKQEIDPSRALFRHDSRKKGKGTKTKNTRGEMLPGENFSSFCLLVPGGTMRKRRLNVSHRRHDSPSPPFTDKNDTILLVAATLLRHQNAYYIATDFCLASTTPGEDKTFAQSYMWVGFSPNAWSMDMYFHFPPRSIF